MDKIYHFLVCFLISAILTLVFESSIPALWFVAGLSFGKEAGDFMNYGHDEGLKFFKGSFLDLISDLMGILTGITVISFLI